MCSSQLEARSSAGDDIESIPSGKEDQMIRTLMSMVWVTLIVGLVFLGSRSEAFVDVGADTIPIDCIVYYPFNGNADDESGNGYDGTVFGATLTSDRFGNANSAYSFNGSGDYIISDAPLPTGSSARSISIWFNTTSASGSNGWFSNTAISWGSPSDNALCSISIYQGMLDFGAFGNPYDVHTWVVVNDGNWHHAVVVYDGSTLKIFLDGVEVASEIRTLNTSFSSLYIGSRSGQSNQYMDGLVDDARVFDRALSEDEIGALYGEGGWFHEAALIDSIVDLPNDQGGWVLTHFTRSGRDFSDEALLPISNYGIWRRMDSAALIAALETQASSTAEKSAAGDTPELRGMPVVTYKGRTYIQSGPGFAASSFPPGTWVWVATVPAVQQDNYIAAVPTAADSSASGTNHTVLVITAHTTTPSIWYVSHPDSGYSVDNLSPDPPRGLGGKYQYPPAELVITWRPNGEADLSHYAVYKGNREDFVPGPSNRIGAPQDTTFVDSSFDPDVSNYYKISALDIHENESEYSLLRPEEITGAGSVPGVPAVTALEQNVPNPFNPLTVIRFAIASPGWVELRVHDVAGRFVRTLVEGVRTVGRYEVTWDGRDGGGVSVASGVYMYELKAPGCVEARKMVLLK